VRFEVFPLQRRVERTSNQGLATLERPSAVLVAISKAFGYALLAIAPLMVVTPILQLSLVFRPFGPSAAGEA